MNPISELNKLDKKSKEIRDLADKVRVESQRQIARLHAGHRMVLKQIRGYVRRLNKKIGDPLLFVLTKTPVFVAFQEYAEAEIVLAIMNREELPELDIPAPTFFTGLCDAIGEVKREFMLALIRKDYGTAEYLLRRSISLGSSVAEANTSSIVINSLKPKKDLVQRSITHMLELGVRAGLELKKHN